jgi:uncharacterized protein (DUF697 family)
MATRKPKTVSSNPLESIGLRASAKTKVAASEKATNVKTNSTVKDDKLSGESRDVKAASSVETVNVTRVAQSGEVKSGYQEFVTAEDILAEEFKSSSSLVVVQPPPDDSADSISNIHALYAVKSWSQWAVVAGFVPVPVADTIAISGVQISMIHDLCNLYEVSFKKEAAISVVSGLLVGKFTTTFANIAGNVFLNNLPVVGTIMKFTTQPALSYATTYALGRVFIRHFERQGTMVDLDSKRLAKYFNEQFAKGRKLFKAEFKSEAVA